MKRGGVKAKIEEQNAPASVERPQALKSATRTISVVYRKGRGRLSRVWQTGIGSLQYDCTRVASHNRHQTQSYRSPTKNRNLKVGR